MTALESIVGQPRAIAQLRSAFSRDAVHHAYLFEGPEGVGKRTTARAFAMAANCEVTPGGGCGACASCHKIAEELHPDVKAFGVFNEEGKEKGQTERVRDLIATLGFPPHEGRRRVVVIDPADALNEQAANVLLKTLEEPPARTHFVLVTAMGASLLDTIRSRCQRVLFRPLDEAAIARALVEKHGIAQAAADSAAGLAQGSIGRALALAGNEEFAERRQLAHALLDAARSRKLRVELEAASQVSSDRDAAVALCELLWITYRDALLVAEGLDAGRVSGARLDEARWLADGAAPAALSRALHEITEAVEAIHGNVGPQLVLEQLVLGLAAAHAA